MGGTTLQTGCWRCLMRWQLSASGRREQGKITNKEKTTVQSQRKKRKRILQVGELTAGDTPN